MAGSAQAAAALPALYCSLPSLLHPAALIAVYGGRRCAGGGGAAGTLLQSAVAIAPTPLRLLRCMAAGVAQAAAALLALPPAPLSDALRQCKELRRPLQVPQ